MAPTATIRNRDAAVANTKKVLDYLKNITVKNGKVQHLSTRLERLESYAVEFDKFQSEYESSDATDIDWDAEVIRRSEYEDMYLDAKGELSELITSITNNQPGKLVTKPDDEVKTQSFKLPNVRIEPFDGDYKKWFTFRDMFNSMIHTNQALSKSTKLIYLKSYLVGKAAKICEILEVSDSNYDIAYELVFTRFEDTKLMVEDFLSEIVNLPQCKRNSFADLLGIVDTMQTNVRALKSLDIKVEHWDAILIYLVTSKLDPDSREKWENESSKTKVPKFSDLMDLLLERSKLLEKLQPSQSSKGITQNKEKPRLHSKAFVATASSSPCALCSKPHFLPNCEKFKMMTVSDRHAHIKEARRCFNCLGKHAVRNCYVKVRCSKCQQKHSSWLHFDNPVIPVASTSNDYPLAISAITPNSHQSDVTLYSDKGGNTQVMLATVKVILSNSFGQSYVARAVLDSGSQSCFITEHMCQLAKLKKVPILQAVNGIGEKPTNIRHKVASTVKSRSTNFAIDLDFLVLPKITNQLPVYKIDLNGLQLPDQVVMADPEFHSPGPIDLLLGAEVFGQIITGKTFLIDNRLPPLQPTVFGHIVMGRVNCSVSPVSLLSFVSIDELNNQIKRFWEIESVIVDNIFSIEEKECEKLFSESTHRKCDGRYVVRLPVKDNINKLGSSKESALRQFFSLERRLNLNKDLKEQYSAFMREYIDLDHMELVSGDQDVMKPRYYIPHHAVIKPSSSTTKLRVVFNASCNTSTGLSLNDILRVGPSVQEDLVSIVTRFRKYPIVMTADICKMYRQVEVNREQQDLQRVFWRFDSSESVNSYKLKTVTYGTASAPYLATRTLNQLSVDESTKYPKASCRVRKDFYVDDLLTGDYNVDSALHLRDEFIRLMSEGCFQLRKWTSNCSRLLEDLPDELRETSSEVISALGVKWLAVQDVFVISLKKDNICKFNSGDLTKRDVYSEIAQLFDPLGLCAPVIFTAKVFMQSLWTFSNLSWGDVIPATVLEPWTLFRNELFNFKDFQVPRLVILNNAKVIELHGFCDASEKGYGACIYIRSSSNNVNFDLKLLCAKSRVAPLKKLSIPRLELCGALLLAQLVCKVKLCMEIDFHKIVLWTDSSIVLGYLNSCPSRFATFVANRVSKIQELTSPSMWHHVASGSNSADVVSRGLMPSELVNCDIWWHGPPFLRAPWKEVTVDTNKCSENLPELRVVKTVLNVTEGLTNLNLILDRFSCFKKLLRVCAWCFRFRSNCVVTKGNRNANPISADELNKTLNSLVRIIQREVFKDELKLINSDKTLKKCSKLKSLSPFLDENGLIRVGGRLQKAQLPYDQIHPILLPANHKFSELMVRFEHDRNLHAAPQTLINIIRQRFWIISIRCLAKRVVHSCFRCFHTKPKIIDQLVGQLPAARVNITRPFTCCGVDFFGPIDVKYKVRTNVTSKAYGCVFVCLSTKAVHLEVSEDLSTDAFLASLRRFISRRGRPSVIHSDNATNFVGANNKLRELRIKFQSEPHMNALLNYCAVEGIKWSFIPARSPHFGGLWEAAVKSAKFHLKRVVTTNTLTIVELNTVLVQIEACLNSRPLTPLSDDPNDLNALTPAHFLIGASLTALPEPSVESENPNRLPRWTRVQQMVQHFWSRWSREYLNQNLQNYKWNARRENLKVGDLVLLKEGNLPPTVWPLGRISEVYPGDDNLVRVVSIRTMKGTYKRSITEVCPLPYALQP